MKKKKTGKLIVQTNPKDQNKLLEIFETGKKNGCKELRLLNAKEINKIEPEVTAETAIWSPKTGIFDSHQFMKAMLDDFERAIDSNKDASEVESVKEGFNLIYTKFKGILDSKGLKVMSAAGETFDSEIHEAIANIPAPSKKMKGKVIEDIEKGYYLNDKVIRFAKVVVGQ